MEDFKDLQEQLREFWPNILYKIGEAIERHENRYHKAERVKFNPPTLEEIKAEEVRYCRGKEYIKTDCEQFRLYWESFGWKSKGKYIHWKPRFQMWIRNGDKWARQERAKRMDFELKKKESQHKSGYNPNL